MYFDENKEEKIPEFDKIRISVFFCFDCHVFVDIKCIIVYNYTKLGRYIILSMA